MTFLPEPDTAAVRLVRPSGERLDLGVGPRTFEGLENTGRLVVEAKAPGFKPLRKRVQQTYDLRANMLLRLEASSVAKRPRPTRPRVFRPRAPKGCIGEDCPQKAARRAASKQPGFLKLIAKPPAEAYVDGRLVSWTPLLNHKLSPGKHTVRLLRKDAPSYDKSFQVVIEPTKTTFKRITYP
jgi:hypothetical protein